MLSGYDLLAFRDAQGQPQFHSGKGELLAALFRGGERSEPPRNSAARSWSQRGSLANAAPFAFPPSVPYCIPLDFLLFLRKQENEADALAQRATGGVRELVQPLDGLSPVRSPAGAAHALWSKLEPLPERRLLASSYCKDE